VEIGRTSIPLLLYNIPQFTSGIAFETVRELLDSGRYAGIKDSSGDWAYFEQLAALRAGRDFTLLVGNDAIFPEARRAGADGVVSGVACAIPELLVKLDAAIRAGDEARSTLLSGHLREFLAWADRFPAPVAVKVATAARGFKVGPLAVPLAPEKCRVLDEFEVWFRDWFPQMVKV
jgi:4-hydroxy-tetrahydrodipicolinate synthase